MSSLLKQEPSHAALSRYINLVEQKYCRFYEGQSKIYYNSLHIFRFIAIIAGVTSSVVAALMDEQIFTSYGRLLLVVIPALGSAATVILTQFRFLSS